jgi:hypothetical protein
MITATIKNIVNLSRSAFSQGEGKIRITKGKMKNRVLSRHLWFTPVIPATQKAEIRRIAVQSQPKQIIHETLSRKKPSQKIGLVEWLKVKALSSSPSTRKKQKST